jgi:hypothetical protein
MWKITFLFCYLVFFWYVLLLHISLVISIYYSSHVALTAFIKLLHCLFCYVFAVYLYCVCCSCFTAAFCGYWLLLPGLCLLACGLTLHMWEKLTSTEEDASIWWQNMYDWPYHFYYKQEGSWENTVEIWTYKHSASLHRMLT